MLQPIRRRLFPASAAPSTRLGHSTAPSREARRAPLYQGSFHSPFAIAHQLTGEWRQWRRLLEHNDVDEPWRPAGGHLSLRVANIDGDEVEDWNEFVTPSEIERALAIEQPSSASFPQRIRLAGRIHGEENDLVTFWAYDASEPEPSDADGLTVRGGDADWDPDERYPDRQIVLSPVPLVLRFDACLLMALAYGLEIELEAMIGATRTYLTSPV